MQEVCLGANLLAQERPEAIAPHAPHFVAFMLAAMDHPASDVAIEATAFWMQYVEVSLPVEALTPVLPRLVERLLTHMVFEEHDDEVAAAVAAEAGGGVEDARELKPFHHSHGAAAGGGDSAADTDDGSPPRPRAPLHPRSAQAPPLRTTPRARACRRGGDDGVHAAALVRAGPGLPGGGARRRAAAARHAHGRSVHT